MTRFSARRGFACVALAAVLSPMLTSCSGEKPHAEGEKEVPGKPSAPDPEKARRDKAIADYTEALRRNPKDADSRGVLSIVKRGGVYAEKGEHDRAIADFTEAIRLYPLIKAPFLSARLMEAHEARGSSYRKKGDYNKAIADYTQVIQFGQGAFKDLGEALAFGGFVAGALYNRGVCYDEKGEPIKAVADFREAERRGLSNEDLHNRMKRARARYAETEHKGRLGPKEREKSYPTPMRAGKTYEIDLASDDFSTRLRLEDDQGKVVAENDGISKDNPNSRLVFTSPGDGSYRIVVASRRATGMGAYTLTIREFTANTK
jgi:hypothetical protein